MRWPVHGAGQPPYRAGMSLTAHLPALVVKLRAEPAAMEAALAERDALWEQRDVFERCYISRTTHSALDRAIKEAQA